MEEHDRLRQARLDELRREVRKGLDSGPTTAWDAKAVKKSARSLLSSKAAGQ